MHSIICKESGNPDGIQIIETSIPRPRKKSGSGQSYGLRVIGVRL